MTKRAVPLLAALMFLSAACVIAIVDRSGEGRSLPIESKYRRTLDLESGGSVILENTDGDIDISGWAKERVDITAYRRRDLPSSGGIYFVGRRFAPPSIRTQRTGDTVTIKTEEEAGGKDENTVHYVLRVPRFVRLEKVSNGRGDIRISDIYGRAVVAARESRVAIENYSGSLDIRVDKGGIRAELLDVRREDTIRIKVDQGDVLLSLEAGIAARFSLEAPAGAISSELDLGQALPARKVASKTGEDGASLEVKTLHGDIQIRKAEGP